MNQDMAFADAARPRPVVVLRLLMREYSIGHELLLIRGRNPLVISNAETFEALPIAKQNHAVIQAALICCRSWEENKRPHRNIRYWGWLNRKADWATEIWQFASYRGNGSTWPTMTMKELQGDKEKGRSLGSPLLARLMPIAAVLNPAAPFDCPLGLANWVFMAQAEQDGCCQVENDFESETRAQSDALIKEVMAEQAAAKGGS